MVEWLMLGDINQQATKQPVDAVQTCEKQGFTMWSHWFLDDLGRTTATSLVNCFCWAQAPQQDICLVYVQFTTELNLTAVQACWHESAPCVQHFFASFAPFPRPLCSPTAGSTVGLR